MKRRHDMPFGAQYREDGSVAFRLWAPSANKVELCLGDVTSATHITLDRRDNGWFELVTDAAKPGTQYRFRIDEAQKVPDPASRFQPRDVHGPSEVIDPDAFFWHDHVWHGRNWEEAVIYELHIGTFTPTGTFAAARERIDYLADLGITALELMPVSDFPGQRNWGYDGVYPFAPDSSYGRPEDLKELVQSAHSRGIMILLDVVYNHFGPEGNYLNCYAPQFFTDRHHTPWGNGINFDGSKSRAVRDFFIHNALYWLTEYHFDGLRLDAVNAIADDSRPDILTELADTVRRSVVPERQVHLILENDRNQSSYLQRATTPKETCRPRTYTAQWNDDIHHALHVLLANEKDGYYADYSNHPIQQLGRCLVEGFAYQGDKSAYRNGATRGEPTGGVPLTAFISFLQNHDQIGNRAFGERIAQLADLRAVRAAAAILLLAPSPPLLFMGEEFAAETPFLFFCDFGKDLAAAVTEGRRNEFAHFSQFSDAAKRERIPDPNAAATFEACRLNWNCLTESPHKEWLEFYRKLLKLRSKYIVPHLYNACDLDARYEVNDHQGLSVHWNFADNSKLTLAANLRMDPISVDTSSLKQIIYASDEVNKETLQQGTLPPWSIVWSLES
jgi:maltooligosyltrehalose trehalohydrolase